MAENSGLLQQVFGLLEQIHKDFDYIATNLAYILDGPTCSSGCGICCQQSFLIPLISGKYIVAQIHKQPDEKQKLIIERLERWVLHKLPNVRMKFSQDGQNEVDIREKEYTTTSLLWCPLLDNKKRCMIYPWRDINCRAWGITRPSGSFCRRPLANGEINDRRIYVSEESIAPLLYQVSMLTGLLVQHNPSYLQHGWMPAMLYMLLQPDKWKEIQDSVQQIKSGALTTNYIWLITFKDLEHLDKDRFSIKESIPIF